MGEVCYCTFIVTLKDLVCATAQMLTLNKRGEPLEQEVSTYEVVVARWKRIDVGGF